MSISVSYLTFAIRLMHPFAEGPMGPYFVDQFQNKSPTPKMAISAGGRRGICDDAGA